ncbi:hypothetical protein J6590_106387 [Homalodisca vitripennis]|nr:hypothetical protein J6590_106387 [Homalodisca vitripennis]
MVPMFYGNFTLKLTSLHVDVDSRARASASWLYIAAVVGKSPAGYLDRAVDTSGEGEFWFRLFMDGDVDTEDKERLGRLETFRDEELENITETDFCQTEEELAATL